MIVKIIKNKSGPNARRREYIFPILKTYVTSIKWYVRNSKALEFYNTITIYNDEVFLSKLFHMK